jgi:hypothetical protein
MASTNAVLLKIRSQEAQKLIQHRSTERRLPKMLNVVHMLNAASAKINNRIELGRHLGKGPRASGPNSDSKCGKHHFFGNIVTEQNPFDSRLANLFDLKPTVAKQVEACQIDRWKFLSLQFAKKKSHDRRI